MMSILFRFQNLNIEITRDKGEHSYTTKTAET